MSDISFQHSLTKTKKYKALRLIMCILWMPVLIPLAALNTIGEYSEKTGRYLCDIRFLMIAKICVLLRWEGVKIDGRN